jgi:O-methyltransferase
VKLPGFRRRATELKRLRGELAELETLRTKLAEAERTILKLRERRGRTPQSELTPEDEEWIERAKKFEYYWSNAHKKIDPLTTSPFGPVAQAVLADDRTYLKADRLYTLWQAVTGMPAAGAAVIEIGTFRGGSAKLIAEGIAAAGRTVPFYACDTFAGHALVDKKIDGRHRVGKQFTDVRADDVAEYLRGYDFVQVVEGDIRETAARFADQRAFGMVHIDVDVYRITRFCLEFFTPRLVAGATIVVDDYGLRTCEGVKAAVDEFMAAHRDTFRALHLLTGQAVLTRVT